MRFHVTRGWAGRLSDGFRLGLLGVLARDEADVAASGIFNRLNRFDEFDIIHQSWVFEAKFIYRVDPDAVSIDPAIFLVPFEYSVWAALVAITVVITVFVRHLKRFQPKFTDVAASGQEDANEPCLDTVTLIGSYCQQGISPVPESLTYRTIIIFILIFSLLLYNYYTSSIVGALLSSPIQGPRTFQEIIASPMTIMFEDIGYNKIMLHEAKTKLMKELVAKKVRARTPNDSVPLYVSIEESIPFLKHGGVALHCEATEAYRDIARSFDATEICDLRAVPGPLEASVINFNLGKFSQYSEAFRIG